MQHRSPWQPLPLELAPDVPLERDITRDVCVVGGGMAGLLTALELIERGRSVVVLERERAASGDTSMTTAHLTAMLDARYRSLAKMHGKHVAQAVAGSHSKAIAQLERIANRYQIECDFRRVSAFLCANDDKQAAELEAERAAASEAGISCELVQAAPLAVGRGPALHVPDQAQFDALKFVAGLLEVLRREGVLMFSPVMVTSIEEAGDRVVVHTASGQSVIAEQVLVATGSPINDVASMHTKQAAYRTYAISAAFEAAELALCWDMEDPYHYVRCATDAVSGRPILIVGGEDHRVGQDTDNEKRFEALAKWMRERFPSVGEVVSRWSGQVFEPSDGLAFIGRNPGQRRVLIVTGESGNGMTYSALAAELVADLMLDQKNPLEAIYDPSRKPSSITALADFVRENVNTVAQYGAWVAPSEFARVEDIPRGQGAILRDGLRRIAAYVDDGGVAHRVSATCPHLGGVVAWNPVEKSWDCPCHGSRFDCHGKVLQGPAVSDLKPEPE